MGSGGTAETVYAYTSTSLGPRGSGSRGTRRRRDREVGDSSGSDSVPSTPSRPTPPTHVPSIDLSRPSTVFRVRRREVSRRPAPPVRAGRASTQHEEWSGHLHDLLPVPLPVRVLDFLCPSPDSVLDVVGPGLESGLSEPYSVPWISFAPTGDHTVLLRIPYFCTSFGTCLQWDLCVCPLETESEHPDNLVFGSLETSYVCTRMSLPATSVPYVPPGPRCTPECPRFHPSPSTVPSKS